MDLHTAGESTSADSRRGKFNVMSIYSPQQSIYFRLRLWGIANRNLCVQILWWRRLVWWGGVPEETTQLVINRETLPFYVVSPISYTHPGCYCREWDALQALACSALLWLHKSTLSEPPTMILFLIRRICRVCTRVRFLFYVIVHKNKCLWFILFLRFMFISNY